jgi:hypothetical protein
MPLLLALLRLRASAHFAHPPDSLQATSKITLPAVFPHPHPFPQREKGDCSLSLRERARGARGARVARVARVREFFERQVLMT